VAPIIRLTGDWDLAEECAQDAFVKAWERWPIDGVPDRPIAWLVTTARNRAFDRLRRASLEARKNQEAVTFASRDDAPAPSDEDDQLSLIFTCCHPSLSIEARVALTLRSVGGLTTTEIARAFLTPERTMVQRLFRARRKIREAAIPFRVPRHEQLAERLDGVLAVLYLVFNEGYHATDGDQVARVDLSEEAIRLTTQLRDLVPDRGEVDALLALMDLHDARRPARVDANGDIVPLEEQDRSRWDHERIRRAVTSIERAGPGRYRIEAAIAACHAVAASVDETDWVEVARLYGELLQVSPSPIVELNQAIAIGMADGPEDGLRALERIDATALAGYPFLPASRADMQRRLGRFPEAAVSYQEAIRLAKNEADRRFLQRRHAEVSGGAAGGGTTAPG
jgi:RNA polymerase sigma-70 factor (ECF subfamily)